MGRRELPANAVRVMLRGWRKNENYLTVAKEAGVSFSTVYKFWRKWDAEKAAPAPTVTAATIGTYAPGSQVFVRGTFTPVKATAVNNGSQASVEDALAALRQALHREIRAQVVSEITSSLK